MAWYSSSQSPFAADMDAPPGGGFAVNAFLPAGDTVFRTGIRRGGMAGLARGLALAADVL